MRFFLSWAALVLSFFLPLVSSHFMDGMYLKGNQLVDVNGNVLTFQGVDRSGTEYACIGGWGFEDGPYTAASFQTMKSWGNVNIVRLPLNEDCWLSGPGSTAGTSGANYKNFIISLVQTIQEQNIGVILDLHWTSGGGVEATAQQPMPNTQYSVPFWTDVATTFSGQLSVIFDLFNEPFPGFPGSDWNCWKNGGTCNGISYQVAGMQTLVNTVRSTGANNFLILGGCQYSNDASGWLTYMPSDPKNFMGASIHTYNFNSCNNQGCWDTYYAPLATKVPVIAGEFGETDNSGQFVNQIVPYFRTHGIGYLGWVWTLNQTPTLILDYTGTVNGAYGQAVQTLYQAFVPSGYGASAPTSSGSSTTQAGGATVAPTTQAATPTACTSTVPVGTTCQATPNCCPTGQLCYLKNQYYAGCFDAGTCVAGIHSDDPVAYQTPWSCNLLTTVTSAPVPTTTTQSTRAMPTTQATTQATTRATTQGTTQAGQTTTHAVATTAAAATGAANGNIFFTISAPQFQAQCSNGQWAIYGLTMAVSVTVQLFGGQPFTQQPMAETTTIDSNGDLAVVNMNWYLNGAPVAVTVSSTFNVGSSATSGNTWSFMLEDDQPNIGGNIYLGSCGSQGMTTPTITASFSCNTFVYGLGTIYEGGDIPAVSALPQVVNYLATANRASSSQGSATIAPTTPIATTFAPGVVTTTHAPTIATAATVTTTAPTQSTTLPSTAPLVMGSGPRCTLTLSVTSQWSTGAVISASYSSCTTALLSFTKATITLPGYVATNMWNAQLLSSDTQGNIAFAPVSYNTNLAQAVGFVATIAPSNGGGVPTAATIDGTSQLFGGGQGNIASSAQVAVVLATTQSNGTNTCPILDPTTASNAAAVNAIQRYCGGQYDVTVVNDSGNSGNGNSGSSGMSTGVTIGIVVGSVAGIIIIAVVVYLIIKKKDNSLQSMKTAQTNQNQLATRV